MCWQLAAELSGRGSGVALHSYSPIEGLPALRAALRNKLAIKNGLTKVCMQITPKMVLFGRQRPHGAIAPRGSGHAYIWIQPSPCAA